MRKMVGNEQETIFWIRERADHVSPIRSVYWRIKDATKFGGPLGSADQRGQLTTLNWTHAMETFAPSCLEIIDSPNPVGLFMSELRKFPYKAFLSKLGHLKVQEWPNLGFQDLKFLLENSKNLRSLDFCDSNYEEKDFFELVSVLRACPSLEAMDLCYPLTSVQLDHAFSALAQEKIKIMRLSVPCGLSLNEFCKSETPCSSVQFLAAQELLFDDASQQALPAVLHFQKLFPNLRYLYLDWNFVDPEVVFDHRTAQVLDALAELKNQLVWLAILCYAPNHETRVEAYKISNYFSADKRLRTKNLEFSTFGSAPNFMLILVGDVDDWRAELLVDVVVDKCNSRPDLRHFVYVFNGAMHRALAFPDLEIEFGGFDKAEIQAKVEQGKNELLEKSEQKLLDSV